MPAENEFVRTGVPAFFVRLRPIIAKGVFDLPGGLIDLGARQVTLDAPFDRLGAARGDPDRRVRLLNGTRPDRAVFELEELAFEAPPGFSPRGHDQVIGFLES